MVPQYMAWKSIIRNMERAFFPIFGIMIGVASIITILSISAGGKRAIEQDLSQIEENRIVIRGENPHPTDLKYLETLEFVRYVEVIPGGVSVGLEDGDGLDELTVSALNRYNSSGKYILIEESKNYAIARRIKNTLTLFLTSLGGIATLLGGIGISNLMASMITKRKGEIGMLMALGAKRDFIFQMFMTEAVILTSMGTLLGGVLGVIVTILVGGAIGIPGVFSAIEIVTVMLFAMITGGGLGILPAHKAAGMNPVEAIRT